MNQPKPAQDRRPRIPSLFTTMSNNNARSTEDARTTKSLHGPWWPSAPRRRMPTIKRAVQKPARARFRGRLPSHDGGRPYL